MQSNPITFQVYQDEPIPRISEHAADFVPQKYREMRKIAQKYNYYNASDARIFYEQGKFMEDLEDDFDFHEDFVRYFLTYQSMTIPQLRGYFSWRTKVRRGIIEKTSLSLAFVYIYELLNKIGVSSPEDGFHTLKHFWTVYREIDAGIDRYARLWLQDYVVYNNLDKSLLEDFRYDDFDQVVFTLLNHRSHDPDEVFAALDSFSSYKFGSSSFFKQYPNDVKQVVYGVFSTLSNHYDKKRKNGLCEKLLGKFYAASYYMFRSAVYYHHPNREDSVYEINDICRYRYVKGHWSCERLFCYKGKTQRIGELLKTIDFLMRKHYSFKSTLKVVKPLKLYQNIIGREIEKFLDAQKKKVVSKIEIDVSRLPHIRKTALETQGKLIVDESEAATPPVADDKNAGHENSADLSDAEYRFLKYMLDGKEYDDFIRSENLMPSILIDAVNEKLFETFGDTVISFDDNDKPVLIEDYIEELKSLFEK